MALALQWKSFSMQENMNALPVAPAEIVRACVDTGDEAAWKAFVRCFQPLIASSVLRVARRYGVPSKTLADDLVQETYLRLCRDNCRALRDFQARHDQAIFGYIKVIATTVAFDHFRARSADKRKGETPLDNSGSEAQITSANMEQSALIGELDRRLAATESSRDRSIFWLYYRQGFTAKDIATMPHIGLSQKGVESCIYRLTQLLRDALKSRGVESKGKPKANTLGVME
jgi:RNA polymerase sigma-70 factor, ECF subfamily